MPPPPHDDQTEFLNVDLEVLSHKSLAPLVRALGKRVFVLHEGRWGRRYGAFLELSGYRNQGNGDNADLLIRHFVGILNDLPRPARRLWNGTSVRQFDLGIKAGLRPPSVSLHVKKQTLEAIAKLGASLVVTVYAAEVPEAAPRRREVRASRPTTGCS